jgi:hypothetical protein
MFSTWNIWRSQKGQKRVFGQTSIFIVCGSTDVIKAIKLKKAFPENKKLLHSNSRQVCKKIWDTREPCRLNIYSPPFCEWVIGKSQFTRTRQKRGRFFDPLYTREREDESARQLFWLEMSFKAWVRWLGREGQIGHAQPEPSQQSL